MTVKHEDEMTPGEYRRWQKDHQGCFPMLCTRCDRELTGQQVLFCTECNGEFHVRCFEAHRCLDAINE